MVKYQKILLFTKSRLTTEELSSLSGFDKRVKTRTLLSIITSLGTAGQDEFDSLMSRCGKLKKLLHVIAYVFRLVGRTASKTAVGLPGVHKLNISDKIKMIRPINETEWNNAWNFLIYVEQKLRLDKRRHKNMILRYVTVELSNGHQITQTVLGSRIKNFPVSFTGKRDIPFLPCGQLALLITKFKSDLLYLI